MIKVADKRASARMPCEQSLTFDLAINDSEGFRSCRHKGSGVDISEHGLGLLTRYPLKKDEVLKLLLPLNIAKTFLPVFARVVWAKSAEG